MIISESQLCQRQVKMSVENKVVALLKPKEFGNVDRTEIKAEKRQPNLQGSVKIWGYFFEAVPRTQK